MRVKLVTMISIAYLLLTAVVSMAVDSDKKPTVTHRVVFVGFEKESAGRYGYLADSVHAMLVSRLASFETIEIVDSAKSLDHSQSVAGSGKKPENTRSITAIDYFISGALFSLNSGLNIQISITPTDQGQESYDFSIVADPSISLIEDMEKLSSDIAQKVFGETVLFPEGKAPEIDITGNQGFVTVHPEAAYKKRQHTVSFTGVEGVGIQVQEQSSMLEIELPGKMLAMTVDDVDSDGREEILVLTGSKIQILQVDNDSYILLDEFDLPANMRCHAMDVADINEDGLSEIYLSGTDRLNVSSMIITWMKETGFTVVGQKIPWYLRPIAIPGDKVRLAGQEKGFGRIDFVKPGIYMLGLDEEHKISKQQKISIPDGVNLFDFVFADLLGDGSKMTVVVDQRERLKVYNSAQELLWVSQKRFGGSKIYLGPSQGDAVNRNDQFQLSVDEEADRVPIFVPAEIAVVDINGDGKQAIIVNENKATTISLFYKLRIYSKGRVVGLSWDGENMQEMWRTGNFRGAVTGYSLSLQASASRREDSSGTVKGSTGKLYVAHVPSIGSLAELLPGGIDTELRVYDLKFDEKSNN